MVCPRVLLPRRLAASRLFQLAILIVFFITGYQYLVRRQLNSKLSQEYKHLQSLRSQTVSSECRIPRPDPWDPSILPYYSKPSPLVCKPVQEQFAKMEKGILKFKKELLAGVRCYLTPFWHKENVSDFDLVYGNRRLIDFSKIGYEFAVTDEFFEIRCTRSGGWDVFNKNFAQILARNSTRPLEGAPSRPIESISTERPAVVIIGFDGMSRQNFLRQMPKSHAQMAEMGFVDMLGHVKIYDNTYTNLVAILRGIRAGSTREFPAQMDENWYLYFDEYEMIWKNFTRNGYATLFAEDRPDIATFNYRKKFYGFKKIPVDHYMRPYWLASYWSMVSWRSTTYCYDDQPMYRILLDYLERFIKKYEKKRHFAFWWTQDASHDYLNRIGMMDDDLEGFLKRIENRMQNTVAIVVSDHGNRYDKIRETVQGRLETSLPYLSIRIPPKIKEQFPFLEKQLLENADRMTTPFDLHEMLNDLAWGTFSDPKKRSPLQFDNSGKPRRPRGYSLFEPIPKNRTCYEAEIPEDYCPCYNEKKIEEKEAQKAADVLLTRINELLMDAPKLERNNYSNYQTFKCARLEIDKIQYASIRLPPQRFVAGRVWQEQMPVAGVKVQYRVVFQAKPPSQAIIEGIAIRDFNTAKWTTTNEFERNNAYGNSSSCVNDPVLKKLCYCLDED